MKQFSYTLTKPLEAHARSVNHLLGQVSRFHSRVKLISDTQEAVVEKPRDLLNMNLLSGNRITVTVEGRDEEAAVAAIQECVVAEF